jgi:hypothetical protein
MRYEQVVEKSSIADNKVAALQQRNYRLFGVND